MIRNLITLVIIGLVLYVIFYLVGLFLSGLILQVVGIILVLIFLLKAIEILKGTL